MQRLPHYVAAARRRSAQAFCVLFLVLSLSLGLTLTASASNYAWTNGAPYGSFGCNIGSGRCVSGEGGIHTDYTHQWIRSRTCVWYYSGYYGSYRVAGCSAYNYFYATNNTDVWWAVSIGYCTSFYTSVDGNTADGLYYSAASGSIYICP